MSEPSKKTTKGTDKAPPPAAKPVVRPAPRAAGEELSDAELKTVAGGENHNSSRSNISSRSNKSQS